MGKSTVERYEDVAADASSTAFLELAKELIETGEPLRAIEVCRTGLAQLPNCIAARVLWGKALICLGRPAEAMEQFDRALELGRENPRTYALISHALVQRGLYRSALPLLQKAAALVPKSEALRRFLEETQRALGGGPPPTVSEQEAAALFEAGPTTPGPPDHSENSGGAMAAASADEPKTREGPGDALTATHDGPAAGTEPAASELRPSLLEDVAEAPEMLITAAPPKQVVSSHEAEQIARQYERKLREELAENSEKASRHFVARHGIKIVAAAILGVALVAGAGIFLAVRHANQGRDLKDDLAEARKAIAQDTPRSYAFALDRLAHALQMDDESVEAWAWTAYARAILYAEHGRSGSDREASRAALDKGRVREHFAGLALASELYAAEPARKEELAKLVLDFNQESPEIHELAGRILLSRKDSKAAVERFRRALALSSGNVRAMVALADYYRESGDHPGALKFYGAAAQISPAHPGIVLGQAESRLELGTDLEEALRQINELPKDELLSPEELARRELALGRLQLARGDYEEAIKKLGEGARVFRPRAFEFQLALGDANRAAGKIDAAQTAYQSALELRPHSEEAKEGMGRALIARDRERELISRFPAQSDARRISLVRGMAFAKLGDWKRARGELAKTQVGGKYPSEAAIYLALADAAEGQPERAQSVLEKLAASSKRARGDVRVGLGTVYWQRGLLDKARSQFEEAAKEPDDYEGACALGRLLISIASVEAALEPLGKAVRRNPFHGEARLALATAQLQLGRLADAIAQLEAWRDRPTSAAAHKSMAAALFRAGRIKEAEAAIAKSLSLDASDAESHRLKAQILFARGDGRDAFPEADKATKLKAADPENWCELGAALVRQGRADAAAKAYEEAVRHGAESICARVGLHYAQLPTATRSAPKELNELAGRAPEFWNRSFALSTLARVLLSVGSAKEARKAAEQSVALYPFSGPAHLALGLCALRQKDDARALEELTKAVELDPTDAGGHLALADALSRSGPNAQAVEHYQWYLRLAANGPDQLRVKRALAQLKKRLALR